MRILRPSNSSRLWPARGRRVAGVLAGLLVACSALAATDSPDSNPPNGPTNQPQAAPTSAAPTTSYSPGIAEVLKMLDAKVDPVVVEAYIKNSPVAYNPNAAEIIALKQRGVPDDILTALLQRGGELRAQTAQANQPASAPAYPTTAAPYAPVPDSGYDYAATPYADYGYGYPGYPYAYPYYYNYWWYNYAYPWGFYPSFFFGHHFHDGHFHDGHFHNFAFNHNSGVHHGFTVPNHSAPFRPVGSFGRPSIAAPSRGAMVRAGGGFGAHAMGHR